MSRPLVYFIDDDIVLTRIFEKRFKDYGCDILSFTDPDDLYKYFLKETPQLLLVDLNLGEGLSGFDVIKKIRHEFKSDIPIIISSGNREQAVMAHGLELGANDYIVKPCFRLEFQDVMSQYINAENLPQAVPQNFQKIKDNMGKSKLRFRVAIQEVYQTGFTIISSHLIKKGTSFHISGKDIKEVTPGVDRIFVRVVNTSTVTIKDKKRYQINLEIDGTQIAALGEVRMFLNAKQTDSVTL